MKLNELHTLIAEGFPVSGQDHPQFFDRMRQMGLEPGAFYQELEMDSRFVNTHRDSSFSNAAMQLHSHSFYELIYCRTNCGAEYLVGSRRYLLQRGDVIFVAPGVSHRPILPEKMTQPYQRDVLWLSEEFVRYLLQSLPADITREPPSHLLRTAGTRWEFLGDLFRKGVKEAEEKLPGWELTVAGNALQLIACLYRALHDQETAPLTAEAPNLLDQVMAYIEANFSSRISLRDAAHHCFASESTISHLFQQKLGVSFYHCVTQRRLIAAKELILQGQRLSDVSISVGFGDYSTFYRAFKQEYGIGPRQYEQLQGNHLPL